MYPNITTLRKYIVKDNKDPSDLSLPGNDLSDIKPDILRILCKKKKSIHFYYYKKTIQEPVNPRRTAKENTLTDVEKDSPKERPTSFCNRIDYEDDTNKQIIGSENSPRQTYVCVINIANEHENEEDE